VPAPDGTDGPTNAAGAVADGQTLGRKPDARSYLNRNDSYHYFEALNDLIITGPDQYNVMDVCSRSGGRGEVRSISVGTGRAACW